MCTLNFIHTVQSMVLHVFLLTSRVGGPSVSPPLLGHHHGTPDTSFEVDRLSCSAKVIVDKWQPPSSSVADASPSLHILRRRERVPAPESSRRVSLLSRAGQIVFSKYLHSHFLRCSSKCVVSFLAVEDPF